MCLPHFSLGPNCSRPIFRADRIDLVQPLTSHLCSVQHSYGATFQELASFPLPPPPPPLSSRVLIKLRMINKSTDLTLPRYRTKCKRLEREAEQGLSAHPQEPLVGHTSNRTSLCVLLMSRFVTTRSNSFEPFFCRKR